MAKLYPYEIRGWVLSFNMTSARRQRRNLLATVVWKASFNVVTVLTDGASGVSDLGASVTSTLTHSNFTSAVASNVNTTLALDTSSLAVVEVTRPPSAIPTLVPTRAPTLVPTKRPSGIPTLLPTISPTSAPSPLPTPSPTDLVYIDRNIPIAVAAWCSDPTYAKTIYGNITKWDTGLVTDISALFSSIHCSSSGTFRELIGAWDGKKPLNIVSLASPYVIHLASNIILISFVSL